MGVLFLPFPQLQSPAIPRSIPPRREATQTRESDIASRSENSAPGSTSVPQLPLARLIDGCGQLTGRLGRRREACDHSPSAPTTNFSKFQRMSSPAPTSDWYRASLCTIDILLLKQRNDPEVVLQKVAISSALPSSGHRTGYGAPPPPPTHRSCVLRKGPGALCTAGGNHLPGDIHKDHCLAGKRTLGKGDPSRRVKESSDNTGVSWAGQRADVLHIQVRTGTEGSASSCLQTGAEQRDGRDQRSARFQQSRLRDGALVRDFPPDPSSLGRVAPPARSEPTPAAALSQPSHTPAGSLPPRTPTTRVTRCSTPALGAQAFCDPSAGRPPTTRPPARQWAVAPKPLPERPGATTTAPVAPW